MRGIEAPFGSDQIIRNYMEILLIELIRYGDQSHPATMVSTAADEHRAQELAKQVIQYMNENLSDKISIDQLCARFAISRTKLMMIMKAKTNLGVREFSTS